MIQTQPAINPAKIATPSHRTGCAYHDSAWQRSTRLGMMLMRKMVDIGSQHAYLVLVEPLVPVGHVTLPTIADRGLDIREGSTV
jgi:hypothetical protein